MAIFSQQQLQETLAELPVGYYAGARVDVDIDQEAETSYFNPLDRKISISVKGANELAKNGKLDKETAARGHLYHELSHAILTPQELKHFNNDIVNIFEDERIETLLDGYYHKVNFRENVKAYAGFDEKMPPPMDAMGRFFSTVRFRVGQKKHLDKLDSIIEEYKDLNWNTGDLKRLEQYARAITSLYRDIAHSMPPTPQEWEQMKQDAKERESQKQGGNGESANRPKEYDKPNSPEQGAGQQGEGAGENAEGNPSAQGEKNEAPQEGDTEKQGAPNPHGAGKEVQAHIKDLLNQAFSQALDKNLYDALESVLLAFNKRNNGGSSLQTYSGIFNPRNCAREDFRLFDRRASVNGTNPFGTLHLNLYIDESGSFYENKVVANNIIRTLLALEKRHKNFSVDFCFLSDEVRYIEDKSKVYLDPNGGNWIGADALDTVKKLQKQGTYNYNIVLMDGWTNSHWGGNKGEYFPFDLSNTTFILDPSCERHGGNRIKNGKVIYSCDYTKELTQHIILTLQRAFR